MSVTGCSCVHSESAEDPCPEVRPIGASRHAFYSSMFNTVHGSNCQKGYSQTYMQVESYQGAITARIQGMKGEL